MRASVKYRVIYRHREKYDIREMCCFFGVSRSGYYDYVKRMNAPAKDLPLAERRKEKVTAELQLHSDQGFPYTSQAYFKLTQRYGITPSMSRRGNPYDNALAENFFSILKTECICRTKIAALADAKKRMDDYIFFYNNPRIQTKTKLTPLELRRQFVA